jgi:thiamine-monophosphate kinase
MALPASLEVAAFDQIVDGLLALAARYGVTLIGGNITRTPGPMVLDVTAIGTVHRRKVLTRAGARVGDEVYVTGSLGDAAIGLMRLQNDHTDTGSAAKYLRPDPRVRAGLLLGRNRAATSCMDLSDGLADGVRQIAQASSVGIALDAAQIPITAEAMEWMSQHKQDPIDLALRGGDDFELIFTVRPRQTGRLRAVRRHLGDLPITRIGVVTRAPRLLVKDGHRERELPEGYEHFR